MNTTRNRGPRLRAALALGAVALLAFAGLAVAKDRSSDRSESTGTITAFDPSSEVLTIETPAGDSFTALVTNRTKIRCEDQRRHGRGRDASSSRRDSGSGDDNGGRGESEPGDDHGGRGNEPGDDNGGDRNQSGEDNGGRNQGSHDDNGVGANCGEEDLSVGAAVHEAELELEHGQARWDEIELSRNR